VASAGRKVDGRFGPGNAFGRGNPHLKKIHALRARLLEVVDVAAVERLGRMLLGQAEAGDLEAVKILLAYTVGKPPAAIELSGPDGEALSLGWDQLTGAILGALARFPEAKVAVAMTLKGLADECKPDDDSERSAIPGDGLGPQPDDGSDGV